MKSAIVFVILLVAVTAKPLDDSKDAVILKYENDNIGIDGYRFAWVLKCSKVFFANENKMCVKKLKKN